MNLYCYRALSVASAPLLACHLMWRGIHDPSYRDRRPERFGRVPEHVRPGSLWFHAVSAGETITAAPLIGSLIEQMPSRHALVTTTTPTGSDQVKRLLGKRVDHCYAPYDISWAVRAFLQKTKPLALVLVETELWPNLIHQTKATGANIYVINARMSQKSANGYSKLGSLTRSMLADVDGIACQYEDSAERFVALGLSEQRIHVAGNIKFDMDVTPEMTFEIAKLRQQWRRDRPAWIAGSTHHPEERIILEAHVELLREHPGLLLILAPRHPHRTDEVETCAQSLGLKPARFSCGANASCNVLIVDQLGVLAQLYGISDAAFIGGSLQATGGHNPVEAAVHGIPLLMGPNRRNFEETCFRYSHAGCLDTVTDAPTIARSVGAYLKSDELRNSTGAVAQRVTARNKGARARTTQLLTEWLSDLN